MKEIPKNRPIVIETKEGKRVAQWSGADNKFAYANPQIDMYEGKWNMCYFENEYIEEKYVLGWSEL